MPKNVAKILDKIEENLKLQQEKLKYLRENMSCIEYWEDHGDGGFWKPLTEEKAMKFAGYNWNVDGFQVNKYYLVKTDTGILILNKEEYKHFAGETHVLYEGSYQACKDFVKI